ncbi:N-acetylmuramoyl-L-alanine amidase [Salipiger pallidus]|uniref:N-acetylmuramoyl-L-alanine amidase n=1 Tax=Salipiger pallidus TaxID=1775170 RepID=A0A8J2ZHC3_9RHOB|nr:N-acetylmuramoyl-L-alanine amidase [Salipiger pallidus]GGG63633.1 N-acetylmuramoyl-L-alanine amidase [Salipiger pallidus]
MVVLHYTAMPDARGVLDWLCDPASNVSAHYVIDRDGTCWQLVREDMRAWHAGLGAWGHVPEVNSRSIGIEIVNTGAEPFPEPQMAALERLMPGIMARWDISPARVIGHSDLAVGRKIDPGRRFDWARLARRGLAIAAPTPARDTDAVPDRAVFHDAARRFGYHFDEQQHEALLQAVRDRFRPEGHGPLAAQDVAIMTALASVYPADTAAVPV